jgi:uncharacterized protein (DUF1919 family)
MLRRLAGHCDFTIVSNNCWGAHVYQALGITYLTPFVGLFIPPKSYLRLLLRFDQAIGSRLSFVCRSECDQINGWRERAKPTYPIAVLDGDVEIHFQHYSSQEEVLTKWSRRVERMAKDPARRFFKFDDRERASAEDIASFCSLPLANKICFTAAPHPGSIVVPAEPNKTHVVDGFTLSRLSRRHFNTLRWISTLPRWVHMPSLL